MDKNREELLQTLVGHMMSVMKHVRHSSPPTEPMLSPPQVHLLFTIGRSQEGISVKEIAERTSVTPGAITQFIDPLVAQGLVAREGDPNDRRIVRLKLTPQARSHFDKFRQEHMASMYKIFEVLSNDEIKQLVALLAKMDTRHEMKDKTYCSN
ncbi:MAG: MarR family winged helix-turn-helix transcriptional regulator [Dehalococcoidales bacterium]